MVVAVVADVGANRVDRRRARGPVHSSLIETATTIRPPTSEFRETMGHWTYHSDGAASSLTPSDRLQRWGQIGWRVNNVQIPIP